MGQVQETATPGIILLPVDRLIAGNANGGTNPNAAHLVLFGERAGRNLGDIDYVYVIGADSLEGGLTATTMSGTVIVGALNASALVEAIPGNFGITGPLVIIGHNNFPLMANRLEASVIIGENIGQNMPAAGLETTGVVMIGKDVLKNQRTLQGNGGSGYTESVFIGRGVAAGDPAIATNGGGTVMAFNVLIGAGVMEETGADLGIPGCAGNSNTIIGYNAGRRGAKGQNNAFQNNVILGQTAWQNVVHSSGNVVIGGGISGNTASNGGQFGCVLIGSGITHTVIDGSSGNIGIGGFIAFGNMRSMNVLIGQNANAGSIWPFNTDTAFELTSTNGVTGGTLLTGKFGGVGADLTNGLQIGHTTAFADRNIPGLNVLKITDGSWNGTPPVGGGMFYSAAGTLHWVDTNGNDNVVAGSGGNISPAALPAGNTDDWSPAGISSARVIHVTSDAAGSVLTGMTGGRPYAIVTIYNNGGQLDLNSEDAGSTAANRFHIPVPSSSAIVADDQSITLQYDATISRWRPISAY